MEQIDFIKNLESARIIQHGLLPKKRHVNKVIPTSFIVYEPKEIVSGDFYWVGNKNNLDYVMVGDCTGHGIAAALLSVLGLNLFEYVIMNKGLKRVDKILQEIDKKFIESFKGEKGIFENPWIDLSLIAIDRENQKVYFSGANRKILFAPRKEEFQLLSGNKYPIGGWQVSTERSFTGMVIPYQTGDMIYLGSDGLQDQFGGRKNKKMKSRKLHELLIEGHKLPLANQKKRILEIFQEWKGGNEQTDDICLIGVRL